MDLLELARRLRVSPGDLIDRTAAAALIGKSPGSLVNRPELYPGFYNPSGARSGGEVVYRRDWIAAFLRDGRAADIGWGRQELPPEPPQTATRAVPIGEIRQRALKWRDREVELRAWLFSTEDTAHESWLAARERRDLWRRLFVSEEWMNDDLFIDGEKDRLTAEIVGEELRGYSVARDFAMSVVREVLRAEQAWLDGDLSAFPTLTHLD